MKRIEYDETFLAQLKRHEGLRLEAYKDTEGVLTIGWGHNCEAAPVPGVEQEGDVISRGSAENLLYQDLKRLARELDDKLPWWRGLDEVRAGVLLDMAFNMGAARLCGFCRTLEAVREGRFADAAAAMLDSRWASQVGRRAVELAAMMRSGRER